MKLKAIIKSMECLAPADWQEDWDKSGLQMGDPEEEVPKILLALDADSRAAEKASACGAGLIITHHPLFFNPAEGLRSYVPEEALLRRLIKEDIAVYSAHTNLDAAPWGVNYALAAALDLEEALTARPLFPLGEEKTPVSCLPGHARFRQKEAGTVSMAAAKLSRRELLARIKKVFSSGIRINFSEDRPLRKIALSGGSWDGAWQESLAASGADAVICGEMKYHDAAALAERGIAAFTLGHAASEKPVLRVLEAYLKKQTDCAIELFGGTDAASLF